MATIHKRKNPTKHSLSRMKTRAGICQESVAIRTMQNASRKGLCIADFPDCKLKDYLKTKDKGKRVKVYKGYIYIFNKTSDRAITLYKIPDEYKEDYEKYGKQ